LMSINIFCQGLSISFAFLGLVLIFVERKKFFRLFILIVPI
jgi:hypothetical protein